MDSHEFLLPYQKRQRIKPIKETVIKSIDRQHTATLFIVDGSGSENHDFDQWVDILNKQELKFSHIKIVYLHIGDGDESTNIWFDLPTIDIDSPELKHSIDLLCRRISEYIYKEIWADRSFIPAERIVIAGFSMGGCLAMHLAYRWFKNIGGCVPMSSFLNNNSCVYSMLTNNQVDDLPELLQFHNVADTHVPIEWGRQTFKQLQNCGVKGTFIPVDKVENELVPRDLIYFKDWLIKKLPKIELKMKLI